MGQWYKEDQYSLELRGAKSNEEVVRYQYIHEMLTDFEKLVNGLNERVMELPPQERDFIRRELAKAYLEYFHWADTHDEFDIGKLIEYTQQRVRGTVIKQLKDNGYTVFAHTELKQLIGG